MPEGSNTGRYTAVAVALHWLVAIGIIFNLWKGLGFDDLPKDQVHAAVALHKSIGITIIGLVALRVLWKIGHPGPAPLASLKPWERKLSVGVHHLLYLLMILVPVAGWFAESAWKGSVGKPLVLFDAIPWFHLPFFNGMDDAGREFWDGIFGETHEIAAKILIAALILHIAGALKHQFLDREKQLQRMWFGK